MLKTLRNNLAAAGEYFGELQQHGLDWRERTYASHWLRRIAGYRAQEMALLNCGYQALGAVLEIRGDAPGACELLALQGQSSEGQSLQELRDLALQHGLTLSALRLGIEDLDAIPHPAFVHADESGFQFDVAAVAAGGDHSLALISDGSLVAWGYNGYGQLGDGTTTRSSYPVQVLDGSGNPFTDAVAIAAGKNHSMALTSAGMVYAWGNNGYGRLGDGTTVTKHYPVRVRDEAGDPLTGILAIAAGERFSLALRSDGTVWTWGYNGYGQLGDGSNSTRYFPARVLDENGTAITAIQGIAAGLHHALALEQDGALLGWGRNNYGQLGDGSTTDQVNPKWIPALVDVRALATGENHSLALAADGTVWAWGYNGSGQLGDGTERIGNSIHWRHRCCRRGRSQYGPARRWHHLGVGLQRQRATG